MPGVGVAVTRAHGGQIRRTDLEKRWLGRGRERERERERKREREGEHWRSAGWARLFTGGVGLGVERPGARASRRVTSAAAEPPSVRRAGGHRGLYSEGQPAGPGSLCLSLGVL